MLDDRIQIQDLRRETRSGSCRTKPETQMQKTYFKEEQYFSRPWFWVFLIVVITASLTPTVVALYSELVLAKPHSENPDPVESLMITLSILIVFYTFIILMFIKMKLVTEVRQDGLYYRYPPFFNKERKFSRDEIQIFEIRKYKPILEYSGWGLRYSWGKSGRALNVKGNIGLQLYLKNGKKMLFGTQRGDALLRAMQKMMKGE